MAKSPAKSDVPAKPELPAKSDIPAKRRPFGRSLEDFYFPRKEGDARLHPAEWKLLEATRMGELATIADERPEKVTKANRIRGSFLRFIALGGDDQNSLHEKGVRLQGAWIEGECDLEGGHLTQDFVVALSVFAEVLTMRGAVARTINLGGSECRAGLKGDRLETKGSVFLRNGFKAQGEVRFLGARIGGDLDCEKGHFENAKGVALHCDGFETKGSVFLNNGFKALGAVRLVGAQIGRVLTCEKGHFENANGVALHCDGLETKGDVFLSTGFKAQGAVRLPGARIGGDLSCIGGHFENAEGDALTCDGAVVSGFFFFREIEAFDGVLDCTKMRCGTLVDDRASWEKASAKGYRLNGFDYASHIRPALPTAESYVQWLSGDLQNKEHGCYPQPWKHLITVLRRQGENDKADIVAMELRERQRLQRDRDDLLRYVLWVWRKIAGYGYRPMRLLGAMLVVFFCCGICFQIARDYGLMAPSNPLVFEDEAFRNCRPENGKPWAVEEDRFNGNWAKCMDGPLEYTAFNPYLYSLDLILPLVDLQQDKDWAPMVQLPESWLKPAGEARPGVPDRTWWGHAVRWLMWFEILFGWVVSLLFVAIVSGLARHEKEE